MVVACQKVYDSVTETTLTHDGNPLLARHIDNAVLKIDNLGSRIVKETRNSPRKIDAAVAFVIAYDRATSKIETMALPEFFSF
jgi:phage terminase large subunit-like protein